MDKWQETGSTMLMITHDIDEAILLADRVIVLLGKPIRTPVELNVTIPRPRSVTSRNQPAFLALREEIWGLLRAEQTKLQLLGRRQDEQRNLVRHLHRDLFRRVGSRLPHICRASVHFAAAKHGCCGALGFARVAARCALVGDLERSAARAVRLDCVWCAAGFCHEHEQTDRTTGLSVYRHIPNDPNYSIITRIYFMVRVRFIGKNRGDDLVYVFSDRRQHV